MCQPTAEQSSGKTKLESEETGLHRAPDYISNYHELVWANHLLPRKLCYVGRSYY
jgi:hypothetical protein